MARAAAFESRIDVIFWMNSKHICDSSSLAMAGSEVALQAFDEGARRKSALFASLPATGTVQLEILEQLHAAGQLDDQAERHGENIGRVAALNGQLPVLAWLDVLPKPQENHS